MPTALQMAADDAALEAAVQRSRKLLHQRALIAAVASAVPFPGLDWAVDAALLSKLIPQINREFGLSPAQIDQLDPAKREQLQQAASVAGTVLVGKFITRDLVIKVVTKIGVRLTGKELAKYVPLAGQIIAAAIGYGAIRYFGEEHMKDCIRVARQAQLGLLAAPPQTPPAPSTDTTRSWFARAAAALPSSLRFKR
jgi:uncharacterized protein (DUF697 family)